MSNFKKVTIQEFLWLLTRTQKVHIDNGEPIPSINKDGNQKIQYCLEAPFMGFGETEFYPTFEHKAAIIFYNICKLHCLLNGNKRMAVETTIYFAWKNERRFYIDKKTLIDLAKKVVESNPNNKDEVVWWISIVFLGGIRVLSTWTMFKLVIFHIPTLFKYYFINWFNKNKSKIKNLLP